MSKQIQESEPYLNRADVEYFALRLKWETALAMVVKEKVKNDVKAFFAAQLEILIRIIEALKNKSLLSAGSDISLELLWEDDKTNARIQLATYLSDYPEYYLTLKALYKCKEEVNKLRTKGTSSGLSSTAFDDGLPVLRMTLSDYQEIISRFLDKM